MVYNETTCDKVDGHCNDQCWCANMKALCAPRCACPDRTDEDDWDGKTQLYNNMRWFRSWLRNHGKIIPRVLKQGLYYICGNRAYSWLPMGAWGNCTIGRVVPAIRQRVNISFTDMIEAEPGNTRYKRELFTTADKAWMWFPAWTGWGIELGNRLNKYASIMD